MLTWVEHRSLDQLCGVTLLGTWYHPNRFAQFLKPVSLLLVFAYLQCLCGNCNIVVTFKPAFLGFLLVVKCHGIHLLPHLPPSLISLRVYLIYFYSPSAIVSVSVCVPYSPYMCLLTLLYLYCFLHVSSSIFHSLYLY